MVEGMWPVPAPTTKGDPYKLWTIDQLWPIGQDSPLASPAHLAIIQTCGQVTPQEVAEDRPDGDPVPAARAQPDHTDAEDVDDDEDDEDAAEEEQPPLETTADEDFTATVCERSSRHEAWRYNGRLPGLRETMRRSQMSGLLFHLGETCQGVRMGRLERNATHLEAPN